MTEKKKSNPLKIIVNVFAFIASIVMLVILIRQISFEEIKEHFSKYGIYEILIIALLYICSMFFRGLRIALVSNMLKDTLKTTVISSIHSFSNHMLPFRLGEFVLPFLYKKFTDKGFVSGGTTLLIVRLYDLITVSMLFIVSIMYYTLTVGFSGWQIYVTLAIALIIVLTAMVLLLSKMLKLASSFACFLLNKVPFEKAKKLSISIESKSKEIIDEINSKSKLDMLLLIPLVSVLVWLSTYTIFFATMIFIGGKIDFITNIAASSGAVLATILPINGLGTIGTLEAGWTFGYTQFGIENNIAIASGFIMHIIIIVTGFAVFVPGIIGLIIEKRLRESKTEKSN